MSKALLYGLLLLSGFWTLFASRASSPDYKALFWNILPFALVHVALAVYFFMRVSVLGKACLTTFSSLALLSFLDLTSRVWLHFGLLSWLLRAFGIKL